MNVVLNKYGFYSIKDKPSQKELSDYYSKKYYQQNKGSYKREYSDIEIKYLHNKIEQKYHLFKNSLHAKSTPSLLDIGCGEGFTMKFYYELGWNVEGIDFSSYGIEHNHPELLERLITGDIFENIQKLINQLKQYDVIWLDNILEHVLDPLELLKKCQKLGNDNAVLIIEVPNDFSVLQNMMVEMGLINPNNWVVYPDHISYFNKQGLTSICLEAGWKCMKIISDFPIDFNIFNQNANYYLDPKKGKGAHTQRVLLDNLFHDISIDKTNKLYEIFADMGLGRQIIGVFNK